MIEWLKTSLPGIIILGAIGGVGTVAILKIGAAIADRYGPPALTNTLGRLYVALNASRHVVDHLRSSNDPRELIVTCFLLSIQFVFSVGTMCAAFVGAVFVASTKTLYWSAFSDLMIALIALFVASLYGVFLVSRVATALYVHMSSPEKAAKTKAEAEFQGKIRRRP